MVSSRRRTRDFAWSLFAAVLLCFAAGASAQAIYRQVDSAGHITYSDRPGPVPLPPTASVSALDVAIALAGNSAMSSRSAYKIDASEAARRLKQARQEFERGAESLPGEQAQGPDASPANHRYLRRQEALQRDVEQAQRRSDATDRLLRELP